MAVVGRPMVLMARKMSRQSAQERSGTAYGSGEIIGTGKTAGRSGEG